MYRRDRQQQTRLKRNDKTSLFHFLHYKTELVVCKFLDIRQSTHMRERERITANAKILSCEFKVIKCGEEIALYSIIPQDAVREREWINLSRDSFFHRSNVETRQIDKTSTYMHDVCIYE